MGSNGPLERTMEVLRLALEAKPDDLDAFLAECCDGDSALASEVTSLLQRDAEATDLFDGLERGAQKLLDCESRPEISGYTLIEPLGIGGTSIVYRAEQERPRREVAIKLLRAGVVDERSLSRFESEAETLGRLDDPRIARVYDAGTLGQGLERRPFIVMELVMGRPLDEWVRSRSAPPRDWLPLFIGICEAVHHANLRGIVHRDLKPSNILVTEDGHPKVLDFGIARVTDETDRSSTGTRGIVGTLPYMSPERVLGDAREVDLRADVYSLGVILYELLTGVRPLPLEGRNLANDLAVLKDREPRPLGDLVRALRGDLEVVVARSLEKEPGRRFASAQDLADDLRRVLAGEPILARPQTASYRLRKLVGRHRGLTVGAVAALLALVIGVVMTAREAARARGAESLALEQERIASRAVEAARRELAVQRELTEFYSELILRAAPHRSLGKHVRLVDVLPLLERGLDRKFANAPEIRVRLHLALADTWDSLGDGEGRAAHNVQRALELIDRHAALEQYRAEALLMRVKSSNDPQIKVDAEALLDASLEGARAQGDLLLEWRIRHTRINLMIVRGENDQAIAASEALIAFAARLENPLYRFAAEEALVSGLNHSEQLERAETLVDELLGRLSELDEEDREPREISLLGYKSGILGKQGRGKEMIPMNRRAVALAESIYGPHHPSTAETRASLGYTLSHAGHFAEGKRELEQALADFEAAGCGEFPIVSEILGTLCAHARREKRDDDAVDLALRCWKIHALWEPPGTEESNRLLLEIEPGLWDLGRRERAVRFLGDYLAALEARSGRDQVAWLQVAAVLLLRRLDFGPIEEARALAEAGCRVAERVEDRPARWTGLFLYRLTCVDARQQRWEAAEKNAKRARDIFQRFPAVSEEKALAACALYHAGQAALRRGDEKTARQRLRRARSELQRFRDMKGVEVEGLQEVVDSIDARLAEIDD